MPVARVQRPAAGKAKRATSRKGAVRVPGPDSVPELPTEKLSCLIPVELADRLRAECERRGITMQHFMLLTLALALPQFERAPVALRVP